MSEFKIKEVFNKTSNNAEKIILEVFKQYCIENIEKKPSKSILKSKDVI